MKKLFSILLLISLIGCFTNKGKTIKTETKDGDNEYYENGNIRIEKIKNGNEEHWIFKQEDGGCWEENFYRDGKIYKEIVYNSDCTKSAEYEMKNGKRHGEWKSYHENGEIREEGIYENGLETGIFKYYDEKGEILKTEYNFILDSLNNPCFSFENNYEYFIKNLANNKTHYEISEDIKVAGNKNYHFPIITAGLSTLYFDHKEGNSISKCFKAELHDCSFKIFDKICPDNGNGDFLTLLGVNWQKGMKYVRVFDLSEKRMYYFYLENDKLSGVRFEPLEVRY